mmetsp:Transcript_25153/g.38965  ORF Transcript_25153/g.38965 Transcript_25153/m.38965 type:complete len:377 (-) Transcript_25153:1212-2342(-)
MEGAPVVDTPKPEEGKKRQRNRKPKNDEPREKQQKPKEEAAAEADQEQSKYRVKKAKDEDAKEEGKTEPKPEKKQRKRKPKGEKAEKTEEAEEGETPGEKKKEEKKEEPRNTVYKNPMDFVETKKFKDKYDEFRNGDWRKGSGKTFVTLETEIPPMPENILEKPNEEAFRKKLAEMSAKINDIHSGIEQKSAQFNDTLTKLKGEGQTEEGEAVPHENLSQKFKQAKEMRDKRNKQQDKVDAVQQQIQKLRNEMSFFNDNIDKFYNKPELVPKGLKQAEKDLYQNGDERAYQRRVKFLKDSVEYINQREKIEVKYKEAQANKKVISEGLPELKKALQKLSKEIDHLKSVQTNVKESKDNYSKELDKLREKKQKDFDI